MKSFPYSFLPYNEAYFISDCKSFTFTSLFWNLMTIMLSISFTVDIKRIND